MALYVYLGVGDDDWVECEVAKWRERERERET
jgi:hypothetical protein